MKLGLTGGIGCGKSTVAEMFADSGWGRLDSDVIVRTLLREDADVIAEVTREFGAGVIGADGAVERRRLAEIVFPHPAALQRLEAILHPRVRALWQAKSAGKTPAHWIVEIPLLFEKALEKEFDFTLCVASHPTVQAQRLTLRGLSPEEASQRIARQLPLAQKIERADFVFTNNGSLAFLRDQVTRLIQFLARSAA